MPTDALMDTTTEDSKGKACVWCKAMRQGADYCRNQQRHCVLEFPPTALSQTHCKILKDFRGGVFHIKDQMDLQLVLSIMAMGKHTWRV